MYQHKKQNDSLNYSANISIRKLKNLELEETIYLAFMSTSTFTGIFSL